MLSYKKQELKSDNLCLNKQNITPQEDYLLNKQIFSGYPKYFLNGANLTSLMYSKTLHEIEDDYTNFITSCPDTSLTNEVKEHTIHYYLLKPEKISRKVV